MKTITVSDEDYETLMELSKELQTQDNNGQAFPYFWEPSSFRLVPNLHDEGEITIFVIDCESHAPKDVWDENEELRLKFIKHESHESDVDYNDPDLDVESEWCSYVRYNCDDIDVYTQDYERTQEHNPSLFKSDVKEFVKYNKHHLGGDPHTYARTVFRMPKMESMVGAVLRLNKDHTEEVNHEVARFLK